MPEEVAAAEVAGELFGGGEALAGALGGAEALGGAGAGELLFDAPAGMSLFDAGAGAASGLAELPSAGGLQPTVGEAVPFGSESSYVGAAPGTYTPGGGATGGAGGVAAAPYTPPQPIAGATPGSTSAAVGTPPGGIEPPAAPTPTATTSPSTTGLSVGSSGAPGGPDIPGVPGAPAEMPSAGPLQPTADQMFPAPQAGGPSPAQVPLYKKAIDAITGNPLMAASLGLNALGQVNASRSGRDAAGQLRAAAQPAKGAADQLVAQGLSGTAPQAVVDQANQTLTNTIEQIKQRYAQMGRDPNADSAAQQEIAKATQQRDAAIFNASQQILSTGLSAAGLAQGPTTQAVLAGQQQDKDLQSAMASTMQSMALLQALQRGQTAGQ